jgi:hypothetical protein
LTPAAECFEQFKWDVLECNVFYPERQFPVENEKCYYEAWEKLQRCLETDPDYVPDPVYVPVPETKFVEEAARYAKQMAEDLARQFRHFKEWASRPVTIPAPSTSSSFWSGVLLGVVVVVAVAAIVLTAGTATAIIVVGTVTIAAGASSIDNSLASGTGAIGIDA